MDLRIDRLANRVLLDSAEDAEAWRAQVDACSRGALGRALSAALPGVLASLGLGPDAEVAVGRLRVRVVVRGGEAGELELSDAWAKAVTSALRAAIEPLARAGGGATSEAAVFPDRFAAEREALFEMLLGLPAPWWMAAVSGGEAPAPAAMIRRWIEVAPERVPAAIAGLARGSESGFDSVLPEPEARALLGELAAVRTARVLSLSAPGVAGAGGSRAGANRQSRPAPSEGAPPFGLTPEEARVAGRTRGAGARGLVAACLVLSRSPSADVSSWVAAGSAGSVSRSAEARDTPVPSGDVAAGTEAPPREADRVDVPPDSGVTAQRADSAVADVPRADFNVDPAHLRSMDGTAEHAVDAGGLLFMVRRVARSSWLDEHRGDALEQRLVALGALALARVFEPLSLASRLAVFKRQWPLVRVFAGTSREPSPAAFSGAPAVLRDIGVVNDRVLADAAALLDVVTSELSPDLALFEAGSRAVFGAGPPPFSAGDPARALACLLCRPGRLVVSAHRADLFLPARSIDVALRLGGWDIDPGFAPHLGRVIRFTYEEPSP